MSHPNDRKPKGDHDFSFDPETARDWAREEQRLQRVQERQREKARLARIRRVIVASKFIQTIGFLVGSLELLLALRFLLRLTAANQDNAFARFIYRISDPFVNPFATLFISPTFNGSANIIDVNLLVAMATYMVLMLLGIWVVRIIANV